MNDKIDSFFFVDKLYEFYTFRILFTFQVTLNKSHFLGQIEPCGRTVTATMMMESARWWMWPNLNRATRGYAILFAPVSHANAEGIVMFGESTDRERMRKGFKVIYKRKKKFFRILYFYVSMLRVFRWALVCVCVWWAVGCMYVIATDLKLFH